MKAYDMCDKYTMKDELYREIFAKTQGSYTCLTNTHIVQKSYFHNTPRLLRLSVGRSFVLFILHFSIHIQAGLASIVSVFTHSVACCKRLPPLFTTLFM